jgi:hypothetical protein
MSGKKKVCDRELALLREVRKRLEVQNRLLDRLIRGGR